MNSIPKPAYVMTEPHLSGHRVVLGYETAEDAYAAHAMISAAPSPAGDEDEVERVGAVIEATAHIIAEGGEDDGIANIEEVARAAIAAMRPAPKLTEEDRARVEEVRARNKVATADALEIGIPEMTELHGWRAISDREALLSLIDKLTEAG